MWAKVLVILLVVGLLPWLLIAGGLAATAIGIVGLVRGPLPRFNVVSRASAIGALMLGLVALGGGGAMAVAVYSPPPPSGTTSSPIAVPATQSTAPTVVPSASTLPPTTRPTTQAPTTVTRPKPSTTVARTTPPTTRRPKVPPPTTVRKAALCGAPPNPYGYNFCGRGGYVLNPRADTCGYFNCIDNFWNGRGHMEKCRDGTYSMSGGRQGSCSHHGGNLRPVYRGP
jgi:hypothetical protein